MSHLAGQILCFEISMVKINAPAQTVFQRLAAADQLLSLLR